MDLYIEDQTISVNVNGLVRDIYEAFNEMSMDLDIFYYMSRLKHNDILYEDLDQALSDTPFCDGDRLSFETRRTMEDWKNLQLVKSGELSLQYVENQTEEMCLEAVRRDGEALEYVKNQTEEICWEAILSVGGALEYVKNQTEEMCLEAVLSNGFNLICVKNQTEEICRAAVWMSGLALEYVRDEELRRMLRRSFAIDDM